MRGAEDRDGDAVEAAAARFGLAVPVQEVQPFAVWPEHWPVFMVFCSSATQWRTSGMDGHPTGLDYSAVRQVCFAQGVKWTASFLSDLQILESTALKVWADKRRHSGKETTDKPKGKGTGSR